MDYKQLFSHPPAGKFADPNSPQFTFRRYFLELKRQLNPNHKHTSLVDDPVHAEKIKEFMEWIDANGCIHPDTHYPAYFKTKDGFLYPGMIALNKISAYSPFVKVPSKLMLTTQLAYYSELNPLFKAYPEMFTKESVPAWEDYILIAYIIWQMSLEKYSFWYPLFQVWPEKADVFYTWNESELKELQDPATLKESLSEADSLKASWMDLYRILAKHPKYFPKHLLTYSLYCRIWELLSSRIFNSFIQTTAFVPYAEFVNHDNADSHYDSDFGKPSKGEKYKEVESSSGVDSDLDKDVEEIEALKDGSPFSTQYTPLDIKDATKEIIKEEASFGSPKELARYKSIDDSFSKDTPHYHVLLTFNEEFEKGEQVFMSYGKDTNKYLLCNYGFVMDYNKYEYYPLRVPNVASIGKIAKQFQIIEKPYTAHSIRIYYQKICQRKIIKVGDKWDTDAEVQSIDYQIEIAGVENAIKLLEIEIYKFPTLLQQDMEVISNKVYTSSKQYFAILYRLWRKKILHHQIYLLRIVHIILERLSTNMDYNEALKPTPIEPTDTFNIQLNRRMIKPYLTAFS